MPRLEEFDRFEVIQRAMRVFWENGYHGTSMQDLVDATGLNRSSIYNSFGSKRSFYKITLDFYEQESNKGFRQILLRSDCPLAAIRKMLENAVDHAENDKEGKGCYILNCKSEMGSSDKDLHQWLQQNQDNSIALFRELIEQGQQDGVINSRSDASAYAYFVFNTFQGLRMTGILIKDRNVLRQIIDNTIEVIQ